MVTWFHLLFVQFVHLYIFKSVNFSKIQFSLDQVAGDSLWFNTQLRPDGTRLVFGAQCVDLKRSPCQLAAPSTFTLKSCPSAFRTFSNPFRKLQLISKADRWCSSYHSSYTLFSELVQAASLSVVMLIQCVLTFGTPSPSHPCPQPLTHLPEPPQRSRQSVKHSRPGTLCEGPCLFRCAASSWCWLFLETAGKEYVIMLLISLGFLEP